MSNFLAIGVYPKGGKRAGVVFRKNNNKILYRITTVNRADLFVDKMYSYAKDLREKVASAEFFLTLESPGNKSHVLEIALVDDMAELRVYQMIDGCAVLKFKWNGELTNLYGPMNDFSVMMLVLRF